ncbi:MAG TPA: GNAT family protein [Pirellulales bacterium]|nr:GNAT family protein [Pirellulales bacterium]
MQLTDDRLVLRPPKLDDVDALYEAARESISTVGRWLPWCHANYQREESIAWINTCRRAWDTSESFPFFIFDAATLRLLGGCSINEIDRPRLRANLGYWVRGADQGRGIATATARLAARFAFQTLGMQRVEIVAAIDNIASQCVAKKLGATREGLLRNRLRIGQSQTDAYGYSLIPGDAL